MAFLPLPCNIQALKNSILTLEMSHLLMLQTSMLQKKNIKKKNDYVKAVRGKQNVLYFIVWAFSLEQICSLELKRPYDVENNRSINITSAFKMAFPNRHARTIILETHRMSNNPPIYPPGFLRTFMWFMF